MVRKGSPVRVRQRAPQEPAAYGGFRRSGAASSLGRMGRYGSVGSSWRPEGMLRPGADCRQNRGGSLSALCADTRRAFERHPARAPAAVAGEGASVPVRGLDELDDDCWAVLATTRVRLVPVAGVAGAVRAPTDRAAQVVIADARKGRALTAASRRRHDRSARPPRGNRCAQGQQLPAARPRPRPSQQGRLNRTLSGRGTRHAAWRQPASSAARA